MVARHHGIEYVAVEYEKAENPGSRDNHTFYVTNLREPVARSISGFKCESPIKLSFNSVSTANISSS